MTDTEKLLAEIVREQQTFTVKLLTERNMLNVECENTSQDLLREIEEACRKATPGPWVRERPCPIDCARCAKSSDPEEYTHGAQSAICPAHDKYNEIITCDSGSYGPRLADAHLIANARTWLPELVKIVRELQAKKGPCCVQGYLEEANAKLAEQREDIVELLRAVGHDECADKCSVAKMRVKYLEVKP